MSAILHSRTSGSAVRRNIARAIAVFGAFALIAAMILPAAGRASADHAPLQAFFGTVVEVAPPNSVTVATDSGVTALAVPGNDVLIGQITAVEDISEGDRVVATVHVESDGTTTAVKLLVIPDLSRTVTRHVLGVVVDQEDGSVVVQDRNGNTITIDVPEGVAVPATGTAVTAVAQLDRATGRLIANTFDNVEDVVLRLQEAKDRATDSDLKEDLEERLERARDQHLSALERARQALDRAQKALQAAIAERDQAKERLAKVQAQFDLLRERYVEAARDRNERLPQLRIEGVLTYEESEWLEPSGIFTLTPRINDADDSVSRKFGWNEDTLAIVPVEIRQSDPSAPGVTATTAQSVAISLNDVKSLIQSGARVTVQYDQNTEPPMSTLITVLPPELPESIQDALDRERLRSISGFITLVEETPNLGTVIGVAVVANREHDLKVAAKVTDDTEIHIDGEPGEFGQLAAGMAVEVEFAAVQADDFESTAASSLAGRLNALRIRARTVVDEDEVHVAGVVAGVDLDARVIGIVLRNGDSLKARIADNAEIVKDGGLVRLDAVKTGDLVLDATRFNRSMLVFTRLVLQSPRAITFSGAITGLDHNPERLTITTGDGRVLVAFVTSATRMRSEQGERLQFSDLRVGNRVTKGELLPVQRDGKTVLVANELVIGQPVISNARGIVRQLDRDAGTVSIAVHAAGSVADATIIKLQVSENGSSVLIKNDVRIRDLETVLPGDIVESVSYVTATGTIVRMSVVSPNLQRVRGVVVEVSDRSLEIETSNGRSVSLLVSEQTVITLNGRRVDSLQNVMRRDIVSEAVYIARASDPTTGAALKLTVLRNVNNTGAFPLPIGPNGAGTVSPSVEVTVSGIIESITGGVWRLAGHRFSVTSATRFFGEKPQPGLVAKATLVSTDNGEFVAVAISVAGRPDVNPSTRPIEIRPVEPGDATDQGDAAGLLRIVGKIQGVERIANGTIVFAVDGVKIFLLENSLVTGTPETGSSVLAIVRRGDNGVLIAISAVFTAAPSSSSGQDGSGETSGDGTSPSGTGATTLGTLSETITVNAIAGRVVAANGRLYLLKAAQLLGLNTGDTITVVVRRVERANVESTLALVDRLALASNPLYAETGNTGSNPLYVAE